jgi:SAM-dependent methyltransferase
MSRFNRLQVQADLWNKRAREDAYFAILSDPLMRDPARRTEAFARSGMQTAAELAPWFFPGAQVLDLGCGIGRVALPVADEVGRIQAVDIAAEMLRLAREYLGSRRNIEFIQTNGDSLPGVAAGSVDFLWSLLCLIHVDKASAWRYFKEFRRVLKPGGVARLQFHNILCDEGLALFLDGLDQPCPEEFYAPEEITRLLAAAGLGVLMTEVNGRFIDCTVTNGPAEDWRRERREGVRFNVVWSAARRLGAALEIHRPLSWTSEWENRLPHWVGFRFAFRAIDPAHPGDGSRDYLRGSAVLRLPPASSGSLRHVLRLETPTCELSGADGEALISHLEFESKPIAQETNSELLVAFIPAGFEWNAAEAPHWGQAAWQQPIKLVPRG